MTPPWGKISCTKRASATRRCNWLQFPFILKTLWRSDKTAIFGTVLSTEDSSFHWSWNDLIWWHCDSSSTIWRRKYPFAKYTVAQLDLIRQWPYLIELSHYCSAFKENLRKLKLSAEQKVDTTAKTIFSYIFEFIPFNQCWKLLHFFWLYFRLYPVIIFSVSHIC